MILCCVAWFFFGFFVSAHLQCMELGILPHGQHDKQHNAPVKQSMLHPARSVQSSEFFTRLPIFIIRGVGHVSVWLPSLVHPGSVQSLCRPFHVTFLIHKCMNLCHIMQISQVELLLDCFVEWRRCLFVCFCSVCLWHLAGCDSVCLKPPILCPPLHRQYKYSSSSVPIRCCSQPSSLVLSRLAFTSQLSPLLSHPLSLTSTTPVQTRGSVTNC